MNSAIYPGSYDPITFGHIDIIKRAASIFDHLTIAVLNNKSKHYLFSVDERVKMIENTLKDLDNISVESYDGLLIDYAKAKNAHVIIRGLRAVTDFEYELQMSQTNAKLSDGSVETIFLNTDLRYAYLSSSTVREVASFGGDISKFVTPDVAKLVYEKYKLK